MEIEKFEPIKIWIRKVCGSKITEKNYLRRLEKFFEHYNVTPNELVEEWKEVRYTWTQRDAYACMQQDTIGLCNVTIPKDLLRENVTHPWQVELNGLDIYFTSTENETHGFVYFNVVDSDMYTIEILGAEVIPELPSFLILPLFMIATLLAVIVYRRKHSM